MTWNPYTYLLDEVLEAWNLLMYIVRIIKLYILNLREIGLNQQPTSKWYAIHLLLVGFVCYQQQRRIINLLFVELCFLLLFKHVDYFILVHLLLLMRINQTSSKFKWTTLDRHLVMHTDRSSGIQVGIMLPIQLTLKLVDLSLHTRYFFLILLPVGQSNLLNLNDPYINVHLFIHFITCQLHLSSSLDLYHNCTAFW